MVRREQTLTSSSVDTCIVVCKYYVCGTQVSDQPMHSFDTLVTEQLVYFAEVSYTDNSNLVEPATEGKAV